MSRLAGPSLNRESRGKIGNGTQEVPLGALSLTESSGTRLGAQCRNNARTLTLKRAPSCVTNARAVSKGFWTINEPRGNPKSQIHAILFRPTVGPLFLSGAKLIVVENIDNTPLA